MFRKIVVCLFLLFLLLFCTSIAVINAQEKFSEGKVSKKLTPVEGRSRWVTIFSIGATAEGFVLNPRDPNLIYVLARPYGIFENGDGKKFWEPVWRILPFWSKKPTKYEASTRITRFDPSDPGVIYISFSIFQAERVVSMTPRPTRTVILRSKDWGKSWEDITGIIKDKRVVDFAIDPKTPEIIYVATSGGLFKSLNGGKSWGQIGDTKSLSQVFLNPELPEEVYVVGNRGLYYSKDGGENFNNITPAIPVKEWRVTRKELKGIRQVFYATLNPHNPQELFAIGRGRDTTDILKSTDKGQSWQVLSSWSYERHPLSPPIVKKLTFHPITKDIVLIHEDEDRTNDQISKSTDGGKTWKPLLTPFSQEISDIAKLHVSPRYFEYVKISDIAILSSGTLYVATNYGVYKTKDEGKTWEMSGFGLPVSRGKLLGIDPHTNSIYVSDHFGRRGFTRQSGYWISNDKGLTWKWYFSPDKKDREDEASGVAHIITASDGTLYMLCVNNRVFKLTPDGKRSELKPPSSYIRISPSNPKVLYAVGGERRGRLFKSEDGGFSWSEIIVPKEKLLQKRKRVYRLPRWYSMELIAVDPQSPNTFYITVGPEDYSRAAIFKTSDGGNSWVDITDNLGFVPSSIVINPFDSKVLYVNDGRKLLCSNDGGKTWKLLKPNADDLSINHMAIHPLNPKILYIATNKGIYRSFDSGNTWQTLNAGLLEANIRKIMVSSDMVLLEGEVTGIYKLME